MDILSIDVFAYFLQLLVSICLGIIISCLSGLYNQPGQEWAIALLCVLSYILVRCVLPLSLFTNGLTSKTINLENKLEKLLWRDWVHGNVDPIKVPQIDVSDDALPSDKFTRYGTTKYPVMGPLDNLTETQANERLQYLADISRTPYRAKSYLEWRTDADARRATDGSPLVSPQDKQPVDYAVDFRRWWPNMTNELGNARDCTAYEPGHPFSCIQEWPAGNQPSAQQVGPILDRSTRRQLEKFTDLEEEPLKAVVADEYRRVYPERPPMWRNAPGKVARNSTHHAWHDLCRHCKVGRCLNGICGSRLVEPGDDNILGASKLIRDYMRADRQLE